MTIEITLTRGQVSLCDDEDAELALFKWYTRKGRNDHTLYAIRSLNPGTLWLHRVIMAKKLGRPLLKSELVDHIDGNGLNNRRENLRLATGSQNQGNARKKAHNKSGYIGVSRYTARDTWHVQISNKGHVVHIGYFDNILDAARAYDIACIEIRGSFARPNYPAAAYGLADWDPKPSAGSG